MASRQLAYSINIRGSLSFYDERKVVCRPLRPRLTATSVLAWRRKQPFGVAAAKFIEHAGGLQKKILCAKLYYVPAIRPTNKETLFRIPLWPFG